MYADWMHHRREREASHHQVLAYLFSAPIRTDRHHRAGNTPRKEH
jgi:hypothetical protein